MAYDGIMTSIVARELSIQLAGARIEKVQQPEPDEIILQVHTTDWGRKKLLMSVSSQAARVHFTALSYENPALPPAFCMLLRKHIQGGKISRVFQRETERIIDMDIETVNEMGFSVSKRLTAEIMGKHSNLILTDIQTGKIIDAVKHISVDVNRVRQILPGLVYVLPPSQGKLDLNSASEDEIRERIAQEGSVSKAVQGFSPSLENQLFGENAAKEDPAGCAAGVIALRDDIRAGRLDPRVYLSSDGSPKDVHGILLKAYAESLDSRSFETVDEAMDWFYSRRLDSNRVMQKAQDLQRSVTALTDKQLLKKQRLLEEIREAESSDSYRVMGELLNANLHLAKPGASSVKVISYYDGQETEIPLDPRFSAAKNAQNYYKKYSKLKSSRKEKLAQLAECEEDIAYLDSVSALIPSASTYEELDLIRAELTDQGFMRSRKAPARGRKQGPKPRRYKTSEGYTLLVGRNNIENDHISLKMGKKTDWWFHTKDIPGSHVVLVCEGADPDPKTMYEAAAVAAWFSKGKQSQNVPVDYVQLKYLKKPAGAKPGKVIFTNNGTVWVDPKDPSL
ncbi:MAG: NFACT family protein [Firmicutes bacterium]|nr:NFACT family protein [Bacillota bacterium]